MNHHDIQFTTDELEMLCQLYLDCQLSVLEEKELELVLMQSNYNSLSINETKRLMAISQSLKFEEREQSNSAWTWALRAAACVAIALSTIAISHNIEQQRGDCIVYVEGEKVDTDLAHKIAEADIAKMQQFMRIVNEQNAQEEAKVKQFINHINHLK